MSAGSLDWLWLAAGWSSAAAGSVLVLWALLWDRSRGRRRCPKCWYDMAGSAVITGGGWRCSECGRMTAREKGLRRTHRRWKWAAVGLVIVTVGAAIALTPAFRSGAWHRWVPSTVLIVALPWTDAGWPWDELERRTEVSNPGVQLLMRDSLYEWQWRLLVRRCAAVLESDLTSASRSRALQQLLFRTPDPAPAAVAIAHSLSDPDARIRWLAAWGMKAARGDLVSQREVCMAALEHAEADPDRRVKEAAALALGFFERLAPNAPPGVGGAAATPSPDDVVAALQGARSDALQRIHLALGVVSRTLTWSYDGESGPFAVARFDLELDGESGRDCVVRVTDAGGFHSDLLVFVAVGESWKCVGCIGVTNQDPRCPPDPRACSGPGTPAWLLLRARGGGDAEDTYAANFDNWFSVSRAGLRPVLSTMVEGYRTRPTLNGCPVDWSLHAGVPRLFTDHGSMFVEYELECTFAAGWSDQWNSLPGAPEARRTRELFTRQGPARFRFDSGSARFLPDVHDQGWGDEQARSDMLMEGPDTFLALNVDQLAETARTADESARSWIGIFLDQCKESPAKSRVKQSLGNGTRQR